MHSAVNIYMKHGFKPWLNEDTRPNIEKHNAMQFKLKAQGLEDHRLLTVPNTVNYLPPLVPESGTWELEIPVAFARSAYGFIADVWTQIMAQQSPKDKPLHIFWNRDIPKPNRLTALFWLLVCEVWPNPNKFNLGSHKFDPWLEAPFMLPQCTHLESAAVQPVNFSASNKHPDVTQTLGALFARSLTRTDRELMALAPDDWAPVHMPKQGFTTHLDAQEACGYARETLIESQLHLYAVEQLRNLVMSRVNIVPGMSTHPKTLYGPAGMHLRPFSETHFGVLAKTVTSVPWGVDMAKVTLDGESCGTHIPQIMPKIWMGFAQEEPNWNHAVAASDWAEAYRKHRNDALHALMNPNHFDWESAERDALVARTAKLKKANRFEKAATPESIMKKTTHDAFAIFAESMKGVK